MEKTNPLHQIVRYRNVYKLKRLLESELYDVNEENGKGEYVITVAAQVENNDEMLDNLLDYENLNPFVCDCQKNTVLHYLACSGKLTLIKKLFERFPNYDIDLENIDGETPFIMAAKMDKNDIMEYLHHKGANINKKNHKGLTALHYTVYNGYTSATRTLLNLGVSENYSDAYALMLLMDWQPDDINDIFLNKDEYPVHEAVSSGNIVKLKELLQVDECPDANEKDDLGRNALLLASELENNDAILELLMNQKSIDLLAEDTRGCTLFHNFSLKGKLYWIQQLRKNFQDINIDIKNVEGETPLMMAAKENHHEIIVYLFGEDANLNIKNRHGLTALHFSVMKGHMDTVKTLISLGAEISIEDNNGCTPLMLSLQCGFPAITEILRSGDIYPLHALVWNRNVKKLKTLLDLHLFDVNEPNEYGFPPLVLLVDKRQIENDDEILHLLLNQKQLNPSLGDKNGYTIFHRLAVEGRKHLLQKLYDRFPEISIDIENAWKETPLILAAKNNHVDTLRYLIEKGAKINHENNKKLTALHYAANNNGLDSFKVLVELGGDLNVRDDYGCTPLMLASNWGYYDIIKFIVEKVNDKYINIKNNRGQSALYKAVLRKFPDIVQLLLNHGADRYAERYNPLDQACFNNDPEIALILINEGYDINYPGPYSSALYSCFLAKSYDCAKILVDAGVKVKGTYPKKKKLEDLADLKMLEIIYNGLDNTKS